MRTFLLLCLLFISSSCLEKRIARQDAKALQRVEAKRSLLDHAFYDGLKLHPCANDTIMMTKMDTISIIQFVENKVKGDTIIKEITKTITRRDTVKISIVDKQKLGILNDSLNSKNKQLSFKDGQLLEKEKQFKEQKKKELYLWITISILICSIGIEIYSKFKKI